MRTVERGPGRGGRRDEEVGGLVDGEEMAESVAADCDIVSFFSLRGFFF